MRTMSKIGLGNLTVAERTSMSDEGRLFAVDNNEDPLKGKHAKTKTKAKKAAKISPIAIQIVFDYWKTRTGKNSNVILDDSRSRSIGSAIHDYGIEGCKEAIDGCLLSDFHMGRNKQNKRYDDLRVIFRGAEQTERFIALCKSNQSRKTEW